jgi:hypothetical protein
MRRNTARIIDANSGNCKIIRRDWIDRESFSGEIGTADNRDERN